MFRVEKNKNKKSVLKGTFHWFYTGVHFVTVAVMVDFMVSRIGQDAPSGPLWTDPLRRSTTSVYSKFFIGAYSISTQIFILYCRQMRSVVLVACLLGSASTALQLPRVGVKDGMLVSKVGRPFYRVLDPDFAGSGIWSDTSRKPLTGSGQYQADSSI